MQPGSNRSAWLLALFSVCLAALTWASALAYLSYGMGDIAVDEPAERARLLAQHQAISRASLALAVISLIGSSWLAGYLHRLIRPASVAVLTLHLVALLWLFFKLLA